MNIHITIMLILFLCFGCTNTNIEMDSIDEEKEPIEESCNEPPYSTLGEYKHLDYHCPEFITFDSTLYAGNYEAVVNDLFEYNLYSFSGEFTSVMDHYYDEFTLPLENNDIDGYFVLSKDFKILYFLTEEKQLSSGYYQNAQTCTILYYE
ncbi:MAG: hypothetical protein PHP11_05875 [Erysipelotrichaceae bacterium]|nr:hypothetical protein [Erysipelotrichaceae bacterium]MDD3924611.1 hypothetical protein [Erysipelotrichaceae bacterium]